MRCTCAVHLYAVGLLQAVAQELPEFLQLLKDMKEKVLAVTEHVKSVKSCVENAEHEKVVAQSL